MPPKINSNSVALITQIRLDSNWYELSAGMIFSEDYGNTVKPVLNGDSKIDKDHNDKL